MDSKYEPRRFARPTALASYLWRSFSGLDTPHASYYTTLMCSILHGRMQWARDWRPLDPHTSFIQASMAPYGLEVALESVFSSCFSVRRRADSTLDGRNRLRWCDGHLEQLSALASWLDKLEDSELHHCACIAMPPARHFCRAAAQYMLGSVLNDDWSKIVLYLTVPADYG